ncbi:hypothetical protein [Brotaphodocola sp.]|uniref:hypothetical protein n=1 Tax=Brotaphodocola sp. TaxID=3073577 RepID=UPI003D7DB341
MAIRAEQDQKVIEHFTPDQKRIYDTWRKRKAQNMPEEQYEKAMKNLEQFMKDCFGGG